MCGHEGFLDHIQCLILVADDPGNQPVKSALVAPHEFSKGDLSPCQRKGDKLAVRLVGKNFGHRTSSVSAFVTAASNFAA
jgi:hypothetical protein